MVGVGEVAEVEVGVGVGGFVGVSGEKGGRGGKEGREGGWG